MKIGPLQSAHGVPRRKAFTLVEMLVVIGIITVILGIALPVTFAARRKASRLRAQHDIQALATGLAEYKNQFNEYPQPGNMDGDKVLFRALTGTYLNGVGKIVPISNPKSGRPQSPLINLEKFNIPAGAEEIEDPGNKAYLYYVATTPAPDITSKTQVAGKYTGGYARNDPSIGVALYYFTNSPSVFRGGDDKDWKVLLGEVDTQGNINPGESPAWTGPFLIWSAGPDHVYGCDKDPSPPNAGHATTDDVTNFPIPQQFVR